LYARKGTLRLTLKLYNLPSLAPQVCGGKKHRRRDISLASILQISHLSCRTLKDAMAYTLGGEGVYIPRKPPNMTFYELIKS